jgi:uncharacterized membrane protein (DUF4010 family)
MGWLDTAEARLGVALGVGFLLGAERERSKGEGPTRSAAGLRTFALVGLLGGAAQRLGGEWGFGIAGLFVAGAVVVAYALGDRSDPGLTTEVALFLDFVIGAFAQTEPRLAAAIGIVAGVILAFRTSLHAMVRERLKAHELLDGLFFATAALVILPLVPDRAVDPLGVVNPFRIWRLVVVVMAIESAGHVAQRLAGARVGLAVAGFVSGFVSSAATIAAMGARAGKDPSILGAAIAGAAASTVATFIYMSLLVGAASPPILEHIAVPLGAAGLVALAYAVFQARRAPSAVSALEIPNPHMFKFRSAILFAVLVTMVTFLSTLIAQRYGQGGVLIATAFAAFADAHAAGASVASVQAAGQISEFLAALGVLIALTTNAVTKIFVAFSTGPRSFFRRIAIGQALVLVALWGTWALDTFLRPP